MANRLREWWTLQPEEERQSADNPLTPLSDSQRRNTLPLLTLAFGWGFLVTGLLTGGALGKGMSFWPDAVQASFFGNLANFAIGAVVGYMGYKTACNSGLLYRLVYGRFGAYIPVLFIALADHRLAGHRGGRLRFRLGAGLRQHGVLRRRAAGRPAVYRNHLFRRQGPGMGQRAFGRGAGGGGALFHRPQRRPGRRLGRLPRAIGRSGGELRIAPERAERGQRRHRLVDRRGGGDGRVHPFRQACLGGYRHTVHRADHRAVVPADRRRAGRRRVWRRRRFHFLPARTGRVHSLAGRHRNERGALDHRRCEPLPPGHPDIEHHAPAAPGHDGDLRAAGNHTGTGGSTSNSCSGSAHWQSGCRP